MRLSFNDKPEKKANEKVGMAIFLLFGIAMIFLGVALSYSNYAFITRGIGAEGTIIDVQSRKDNDGQTMYTPTIQYMTADGETKEFASSVSLSIRPTEGRRVKVLYLPEQDRAEVNSLTSLYLAPIILFLLGPIFCVVFFFSRAEMKRKSEKKRHLLENGRSIEARVTSIQSTNRKSIQHKFVDINTAPGNGNGGAPISDDDLAYRIRTVWKDDEGLERTFYSPTISEDPQVIVKVGQSLHFRADPANLNEYVIEPDQLPGIKLID